MAALTIKLDGRDLDKWDDTWLKRSRKGQEMRTLDNITYKFYQFLVEGKPLDILGIVGDLFICWIRNTFTGLSPAWADDAPETTEYENKVMLPSEALYSFMAWLTTRERSITLGDQYPASGADLVGAFIEANHLPEPRDHYPVVTPTL